METENALIESTSLTIDDHDVLSLWLYLDFGGSAQGFGGFVLEGKYDRLQEQREPHVLAGFAIRRILDTVGVGKWENLKGKYVRARHDSGKVHAIGHIIKDQWFTPEEEFAPFIKKDPVT